MLFLENVKLALTAIRINKMRSFLTMLGIIIGISSVIAITSIGASAKGAVSNEFESMGASYMYLMPNWSMQQDGQGFWEADLFSDEDIEALKERFPDDIKYAEPYASEGCTTKVARIEGKLNLQGVGANYNNFAKNISIIHGRMINEQDVKAKRYNAVIDVKGAKNFFGKEDVVGETIPITLGGNQVDATIIGVYKTADSVFAGMNNSNSYGMFMPQTVVRPPGQDYFSYVEIYANPKKDINVQGQQFAEYLCKIKDKPAEFYIFESAEGQLGMINKVLGVISIAIGAIAAISLLVGGIGIMNIMLVSVTERTREIGIRKSLGARTRDILTQFLIEAMILSGIGGIIGTVFGIGIAGLGMMIAKVDLVVQPGAVFGAVIFSAMVGLFFGMFPAKKAAKLDPIEALRYE